MEDALILVGLGLVSPTAVSVLGVFQMRRTLRDVRETCAPLDACEESRDEYGVDRVVCETSQLHIDQCASMARTRSVLTTMVTVVQ